MAFLFPLSMTKNDIADLLSFYFTSFAYASPIFYDIYANYSYNAYSADVIFYSVNLLDNVDRDPI